MAKGEVEEEGTLGNDRVSLGRLSARYRGALAVMEAGAISPWISRYLEGLGWEVIVSNPRKVRAVAASPTEVSPLPTPTTVIEKQSRTSLKHRKRPLLYHVFLAEVSDIIALNQQLPAGVKNASIRKQNVPISPIEREIYTIDGDLWRVKMEGNDNEYHLEISAQGAGRTAKRIIVEVPPDPRLRSDASQPSVNASGRLHI